MNSRREIERVAGWLCGARYVTALTGAGISTDSGIPDFRGPNGVWTKDPKAERLSSLENYVRERDVRERAWRLRLEHPAWSAAPNAAHRAVAALEADGKLQTLITQNIDGLHQKAGSSVETLIEIHGTIREVVCLSCGERAAMEKALARVRAGEADPRCHSCGGILKSATVSFGQNLVEDDLARARRAAERCDVFLAIGTSLTVYPVAYLPLIAVRRRARLAIFNAEPTSLDGEADAVIRQPLGRALPEVVELVAGRGFEPLKA